MSRGNAAESLYYSGQGEIFVSERKSDGTPAGFRNIGNVAGISISMETTTLEHKESSTGSRTTDVRLITENLATVTLTAESYEAKNLAIGLFGNTTSIVGATVTDYLTRAKSGAMSITDHMQISNVSVDRTADGGFVFASVIATDALTIDTDTYTAVSTGNDVAAKEFDIGASDQEAINNLVSVIQGQTTTLTYEARVSATANRVDIYALTPGVGGNSIATTTPDATITPDGATLANGGTATVTTDYTVNAEWGSINIISTGSIPDDTNIHIDYTHASVDRVDAFTAGQKELWLRFEGVNTIPEDGVSLQPHVVDVFKFVPDPLSEQQLIGDDIGQIEITGSALADTSRPAGTSQFFRQFNIPFTSNTNL